VASDETDYNPEIRRRNTVMQVASSGKSQANAIGVAKVTKLSLFARSEKLNNPNYVWSEASRNHESGLERAAISDSDNARWSLLLDGYRLPLRMQTPVLKLNACGVVAVVVEVFNLATLLSKSGVLVVLYPPTGHKVAIHRARTQLLPESKTLRRGDLYK